MRNTRCGGGSSSPSSRRPGSRSRCRCLPDWAMGDRNRSRTRLRPEAVAWCFTEKTYPPQDSVGIPTDCGCCGDLRCDRGRRPNRFDASGLRIRGPSSTPHPTPPPRTIDVGHEQRRVRMRAIGRVACRPWEFEFWHRARRLAHDRPRPGVGDDRRRTDGHPDVAADIAMSPLRTTKRPLAVR